MGGVFAVCPRRKNNNKNKQTKALSLSARESAHVATLGLACTLQHFQSQFQCVSVTMMTKKTLAGPTWTFYGFSTAIIL